MTSLYPDQNLTDDQVKQCLDFLFERLLAKMKLEPKQELALRDKKEEIINQLFVSLKKQGNELTPEHFKNPALLNKLFVNLMVTVLHEKHFDKAFMDKLILDLKKINPKFDPSKIKNPKDLEEFFSGKELEAVKALLTPEVMKKWHALNQETYQKLSPFSDKNKPDMLKKKTAEVEEVDNALTNLFGMICPHTASGYIPTGTLIAAVPEYNGNAGNFTDFNPETHGYDNIGSINDPSDSQFGDPLGLITETISNYLQEGADLVEEMIDHVRSQPPRPHPGGTQ